MGSVQSEVECPNCKSENAFEDFRFKTGESMTSCPDCGYYHSVSIERDKEGKIIFKNGVPDEVYDESNITIIEEQIETPFGAFRISLTNGCAECGTIENEESFHNFSLNCNEMINEPDHTIAEIIVSRFVDGKFEKITLFSKEA